MVDQSELEENDAVPSTRKRAIGAKCGKTCSRCLARENSCKPVTVVFGLAPDWFQKHKQIARGSQRNVRQNHTKAFVEKPKESKGLIILKAEKIETVSNARRKSYFLTYLKAKMSMLEPGRAHLIKSDPVDIF